MSVTNQPDYVRYACTCGSLKPITKMYFCRHCLKVRCGYCVCHEVESNYCTNCMENIPSSEARLKKNRCASCFDCPSCFQNLSLRTSIGIRTAEDGTKTPGKVYYLSCLFCRWTSRDVGIPDQTVATGSWPEKENVHNARINSLLEYYKVVAMKEKAEKDKKNYHLPRRSYTHFVEKFGINGISARKRAGLSSLPTGRNADQGKLPELVPSEATEEVEPLPDTFFTDVPDLTKITTLEQRFVQPDEQPVFTKDLHPPHRRLFIKRSQRCRACEHNVCKPEVNPTSIKFKIQHAAYYHMPSVRILTFEPLRAGRACSIVLKLINPTQHLTSVQFCPLPTPEEEERDLEIETKLTIKKEVIEKPSGRESLSLPSLAQPVVLSEPPRKVNISLTAAVSLPPGGIVLPPRDDAAEYDDSGDTHNFQDDPKVVVWRKGNKAAVKFTITPSDAEIGTPVNCGFVLCYGYVNTMASLDQREPVRVDLQVKIYLNPGKIVGDEC